MDSKDYTAVQPERKRGQHLGPEERGAIKALKKQGFGVRAISRAIGCAPSTVTNELERGTPPGKTSKAVMDAMAALRAEYGEHFPQVFKTITVDNGSEFAGFAQTEAWGSKVSLPILTPHESVPRTSGTTACSGRSSPRASPLSCSSMRTSLQLLTS